MIKALSTTNVARLAWRDFVNNWRPLVGFEMGFKLLEGWLLAPASATILSAVMFFTGRAALANRQIVDFLLAPTGLLYGILLVVAVIALLLVEQACIMQIATAGPTNSVKPLRQRLPALLKTLGQIAKLGAIQAAILSLALAPLIVAAAITYWALLTEYDIYYYWKTRPTSFWLAIGVGLVLLAVATVVATLLLIRWAIALPLVLFTNTSASVALRESAQRLRGHAWRAGGLLVGWQLATWIVGLGAMGAFRLFAARWLPSTIAISTLTVVTLLVTHAVLLACWTFASAVGHGLITRQLYLALGHHPNYENEYAPSDTIQVKADRSSTSAWQKAGLAATALVLVSAPIAIWADVSRNLWVAPHVQITAHRGHARRAPENTLSALRKAIESGADYAEIDVQLTADGTIVLLHDRDLRRVAGDSRRIAAVTWDDLQDIDVGSWFNPIFADERIPTLAQAFDLVRGRMKLNIELKFYGPNPALAPAVAQLIRDHQFEDNCVVTSFDYEALQQARKFCPRLRTGLIVARSLGNIARLQVNALSVRAEHLTDTMLRQAHLNNQDVFAWTVNEPARMLTLMRRGVDNLISSDPDLAIRMRNQWSHMSPAERLLTAARMLMALDP